MLSVYHGSRQEAVNRHEKTSLKIETVCGLIVSCTMKKWANQLRFRKLRVKTGRPIGPSDQLVCVVGDIHGQLKCLKRLTGHFEDAARRYLTSQDLMIFLGDYVDRDLEVRGVLDYLIELRSRRECIFLRGNHEQMLLDFLNDPDAGKDWIRIGGLETLASYGVAIDLRHKTDIDWLRVQDQFGRALPDEHRRFLERTEFSYCAGDFFFAHAGIDPARSLLDQSPRDLLTIRRRFLNNRDIREKIVVHGHSHVTKPEVRRNRIGVDTGAYATKVLSALLIWNETAEFIES